MYTQPKDPVEIDASFFNRLKQDCSTAAVFTTVCHDPLQISGVTSIYTIDGSVIAEHLNTVASKTSEKYTVTYKLYDTFLSASDVVGELLESQVEQQRQSDHEVPFSWHLEHATEQVATNETVMEYNDSYVGPERFDPPFDVPDDEPVLVLDVSSMVHHEIKEAQEYDVGLPITIERFRGETYLIGINQEGCKLLSDACHSRKQDHKGMDFFEEVEYADKAARVLSRQTIEPAEQPA